MAKIEAGFKDPQSGMTFYGGEPGDKANWGSAPMPKVGWVDESTGYAFLGGTPGNKDSWKKLQQIEDGAVESFIRRAANSALFSWGDEALAWLQSGRDPLSALLGRERPKDLPTYEQALSKNREQLESDAKNLGTVGSIAADLAGGLATGGLGTAKLGAHAAKAGWGLGKRAAGMAGLGGAEGTAFAYGAQHEKDLGNAAITGGGMGATIAGSIPLIGAGYRAAAPHLKEWGTRPIELLTQGRARRTDPGAATTISRSGEKQVVREMTDALERTGITNRQQLVKAAQDSRLGGSPAAYPFVAPGEQGVRVRQSLIKDAKRITHQPDLGPNSAHNWSNTFAEQQLRPGGKLQQDKLIDEMFDKAGEGARAGDAATVAAYDSAVKKAQDAIGGLKKKGVSRVRLPALKGLHESADHGAAAVRQAFNDALNTTATRGTFKLPKGGWDEFYKTARRSYDLDFLKELRATASARAHSDKATFADKEFKKQLDEILTGEKGTPTKLTKELAARWQATALAHDAQDAFKSGLSLFDNSSSRILTDKLQDIAAQNANRKDVRLGVLHATANKARDNWKNPRQTAAEIFDNPSRSKIFDDIVNESEGLQKGLSSEAMSQRLHQIADRDEFVAAIRQKLRSAPLEKDKALESMFDAIRMSQTSPVYGSSLAAQRTSKWYPEARSYARVKMAMDPTYKVTEKVSRKDKIKAAITGKNAPTPNQINVLEAIAREMDKRARKPDDTKRMALINALAKAGVFGMASQ